MSFWSWDSTDFDRPFGDHDPWFSDRWFDDWRRGRRGDRWDRPSHALTTRGETGAVTLRPRMDLHENSDNNTMTAMFELPGLSKDNVQIHVQNDRLEVSGESKLSKEYEEGGFAVRERQSGRFYRSLPISQGVSEKDVKASFENGVLTVTFPKTTKETAPKRITVS